MGSYLTRFGNRIMKFRDDDNDNSRDVEMYEDACKESKKGIAIIMEGLDNGDMEAIEAGAMRAWEGIKTMKKLSNKMKHQYGERRHDDMYMRGGYGNYGNRHDGDWNERDDEMMERRMRDIRGRFM